MEGGTCMMPTHFNEVQTSSDCYGVNNLRIKIRTFQLPSVDEGEDLQVYHGSLLTDASQKDLFVAKSGAELQI
ncbi:hypothetical protein HNY73_015376 [Argiope bruennichi]|uniref:Uncharacterized protein n=1 Tax=Argiope bruennichi TaxID=94029 RepID=A0A8T0EWB9_ARGBR|nr:hypothetical protein HNY73_015376 [Argiope bruennichi]